MAIIYQRKKTAGVSVITCTNRIDYLDSIFNNYLRQNYKTKELIIILNNNSMNIDNYFKKATQYENIRVFKLDENKFTSECKNFAFNHSKHDYIAFFDDDDYYGPNYLTQAINAFNNTKADIVGKKGCYIYFESLKTLALLARKKTNIYVDKVSDSSMVIKRDVLENIKFPTTEKSGMDSKFQKICSDQGYKIYCTDYFNYVIHRHNESKHEHTWQIKDNDLLKQCTIIKNNIVKYQKFVNN